MRKFLVLSTLLVTLLLIAAVFPSGCGRSEKGEASGEEKAVSEAEEQAGTEEPAKTGKVEETEEAEEAPSRETEGESMPFTFDAQSIGSGGVPGLVINDVRWSDHGDYYRIVFEIHRTDGTDTTTLPTTQSWYGSADQRRLLIFFLGTDVSDSQFDELEEEVFLGDSRVTALRRQMGASTLETTFAVVTNEPSRHYLHYVTGPMRVILDIEK